VVTASVALPVGLNGVTLTPPTMAVPAGREPLIPKLVFPIEPPAWNGDPRAVFTAVRLTLLRCRKALRLNVPVSLVAAGEPSAPRLVFVRFAAVIWADWFAALASLVPPPPPPPVTGRGVAADTGTRWPDGPT
jgi:hypothetical protein